VVVSLHGGPEGQTKPGFSVWEQMFVDAGFVVVEPNVRGSEGYGKAWSHADDGPKRLAIITDIEDASKWVRAKFASGGKEPKVGGYDRSSSFKARAIRACRRGRPSRFTTRSSARVCPAS
jgi:hypothetical protein